MSRKAFIFGLLIAGMLIISLYRAKYGAREAREELKVTEAQIELALEKKSELETELSYLSRREWIETYARDRLGMRPARPAQVASESDLDILVGPPIESGTPRTSHDGGGS